MSLIHLSSVVSVAVVALVAAASTAAAQRPILDSIHFGDETSEAAHALSESAAAIQKGGLGETCRRIGSDGFLRWTSRCDPQGPNYLTVKLWGSDVGPGQLYLCDGDTRIGAYQREWPELDNTGGHRGHDPVAPGRFFYSTYLLPDEMTRGASEVTLTIGSTGQPRPYSTVQEAAQDRLSRGIYRAYVGLDPFLEPLADEQQGTMPVPVAPLGDTEGRDAIAFLHAKIDEAVDRFLPWQYYGPEWDAWVADGEGPESLTGAFCIGGARDEKWTEQEYLDQLAARMGGNRVGLLIPEILARTYQAPWSRHYQSPELVPRVVLALDYARRAQGNNGGFDDIWEHRWIGGPERRRAGNCLEGFGQMGLPAAFLSLRAEIEAGGYLTESIDDDLDPDTAELPRAEAWISLFLEGRSYLTSDIGRGHAPNQDMSDIVAAYLYDQCLRVLSPDDAWPEETVQRYLDIAFGFEKDVYGGYWISRKGISCEPHGTSNGGYCGCYGDLTGMMLYLARLTGSRRLADRALECARALSKFRYPSLDADLRPVIRREGVVTWRNNWTPGEIDYGGNPY
ncbi:MAG TPA: hypothetical protein QGH10_02960, partial [Armatimonadota bacterium]|nr:hypothetical protein [Armatimonadota bacterium]